jgi:hypothetical protein
MNAVRHLPLGSAIDIPWGWMEQHHLTEGSVITPTIDLYDEQKITQTAARFFFAFMLPSIAKPFGCANLGLGITHFFWCVVNIKKIHSQQEGYTREDVEKAFIRISAGVYDLAIAYLLRSSLMNSIVGRFSIPLVVALFPTYVIQLHHLIFEKAQSIFKEQEKEINKTNHSALRAGCLIKQFCEGLTFMLFPPPEPKSSRWLAIPSSLQVFASATLRRIFPPGKPKPVDKTT